MLKRRDFVRLVSGMVSAPSILWQSASHAQLLGKVFRIGFVGLPRAESLPKRPEAFRQGMRELGYQEGRHFVIEYRWADENYDRLPALFADLVRLRVDVIVTHGTPGVLAAKRATTSIPIIMAVVGDALGSGIVSNLARPEGNVTGSTYFNPELAAKRLELLKEAMPSLTQVGILLNSANPMNEPILPQMKHTADALNLVLHQYAVRRPKEFESAFAAMATDGISAMVVIDDAVLLANAPTLAVLSLNRRLPSIGFPDFASDGGMLAYGVDFLDLFRRAAGFVDKILRGAKPKDLPVERATKFTTIVNLKTARSIGINVPTALLERADEVLE